MSILCILNFHGPNAATAAAIAVDTFSDVKHIGPIQFVSHCPMFLRQVQPLSLLQVFLLLNLTSVNKP